MTRPARSIPTERIPVNTMKTSSWLRARVLITAAVALATVAATATSAAATATATPSTGASSAPGTTTSASASAPTSAPVGTSTTAGTPAVGSAKDKDQPCQGPSDSSGCDVMEVRNMTGLTLKLTDIKTSAPRPLNDLPVLESIVAVGDSQFLGLEENFLIHSPQSAVLSYLLLDEDNTQEGTLDIQVSADMLSAFEIRGQTGAKKFALTRFRADGDATGAAITPVTADNRTLDATSPDGQRLLDMIDYNSTSLNWDYDVASTEKTLSAPHDVPHFPVVYNCTQAPYTKDLSWTDSYSVTNTNGIKYSGTLKAVVEASFERNYSSTTSETWEFSQDLGVTVQVGNMVSGKAQTPIVQQTGTLTLRFGPSTWTITNAQLSMIDTDPVRQEVYLLTESPQPAGSSDQCS
jgi:hypothetical protein